MTPLASDTKLQPSATDSDARNDAPAPRVWAPDLGNGRYRNPIIHADYSDPDVIRHGNDYFMTASSFNCTPGLPILHSHDLVNWTLINHAVKNLPHPRYSQVQSGCGIWAPSLRHHDGKFWIFFPMPDEGIYCVSATDPAAEWSEPHLVQPGKGLIDPCPIWDDDGRAYLVHAYAHSRCGIKHCLRVRPMAPDGSRLLDEGEIVYQQPQKHPTLEGPKFLKRDGYYYICAPAGGVPTGWQAVLRSRSIFGPYEDKTVLAQGGTPINGPHQGALVDTPGGQWWFIHFQDAGAYGRITHLQPVKWRDGWPVVGINHNGDGIGEPVLEHAKPEAASTSRPLVPQTTDEFDSPKLGLQWQWNANHRESWYSLTARPGWLRLFAQPNPADDFAQAPHLLMQKFPAPSFTATTVVELPPGEADLGAGLMVLGRSYAGLVVKRCEGVLLVHQVSRDRDWVDDREAVHEAVAGLDGPVWLRVEVKPEADCIFSYSSDGRKFISLGQPFVATQGIWVGARVGIVATGEDSFVDYKYFRVGK